MRNLRLAVKRSQVGTEQTLAELQPSCLDSREARGDASQTRPMCVSGSERARRALGADAALMLTLVFALTFQS